MKWPVMGDPTVSRSLVNKSDVDRCHKVSRRIWVEPCVALQMHLDGVTYGLADVGDGDVRGVHPYGVPMAEWIGGVCVRLLTKNALTKASQKFLVLLLRFSRTDQATKELV